MELSEARRLTALKLWWLGYLPQSRADYMINGSANATRAKSVRETIVRERIPRKSLLPSIRKPPCIKVTTNRQASLHQSERPRRASVTFQ